MIRVRIEVEHYDGQIEVTRDDSAWPVGTSSPIERLQKTIACAEASAIAAMRAVPQR